MFCYRGIIGITVRWDAANQEETSVMLTINQCEGKVLLLVRGRHIY
jgi:hypothetical protein